MTFRSYMDIALDEARAAAARGEVPVGAVIVTPSGAIAARAGNRTRELSDPTAHAEILAIRAATRIARLYYGAADPKSGGVAMGARVFSHPQCHHVPEIYDGIAATEAETLLKTFFRDRRSGSE